MVAHTFNPSTWEVDAREDLHEFEVSLIYKRELWTIWGYTVRPCLKQQQQNKTTETLTFLRNSSCHRRCVLNGFVCFSPHCGRLCHDSKMGKEDTDDEWTFPHTAGGGPSPSQDGRTAGRRVSMTHCSGEVVESLLQGGDEVGSDGTFVRDEVLISQRKKNLRREEL